MNSREVARLTDVGGELVDFAVDSDVLGVGVSLGEQARPIFGPDRIFAGKSSKQGRRGDAFKAGSPVFSLTRDRTSRPFSKAIGWRWSRSSRRIWLTGQ